MARLLTPFTLSNSRPASTSRNGGLEEALSSMLSDFWGNSWEGASDLAPSITSPRVDIWEEENAFKMEADLPGVSEKDVDVTVHDGMLTVKATTESSKTEGDEGKTFYRRERSTTSFERHISLPEGINEEQVDASLKNGVLTVTLPKSEDAKPKTRKISVKSS